MRLYELIKQLSNMITPDTDVFYNYVLYTSDDNYGFLRTRYCWRTTPVKDREIGESYKKVLVTSEKPIDIKKLRNKKATNVKIQIHYDIWDATVEDAEWDAQVGYEHVYIFDLEKGTFSEMDKKIKDFEDVVDYNDNDCNNLHNLTKEEHDSLEVMKSKLNIKDENLEAKKDDNES